MPTLDYWNQYAKDHLVWYNDEMAKFIRDLVVSLRAQNVLEIGCSAGNDLKLFPDEMNVNGIDTSDMAITLAKENLPKFSFKAGNITKTLQKSFMDVAMGKDERFIQWLQYV